MFGRKACAKRVSQKKTRLHMVVAAIETTFSYPYSIKWFPPRRGLGDQIYTTLLLLVITKRLFHIIRKHYQQLHINKKCT